MTVLLLFLAVGCADETSLIPPTVPQTTIHVSTLGRDSADGSLDHPVRHFARGLELALFHHATEIRISSGSFIEPVHLVGGIDIRGGCNPSTWEQIPGEVSTFRYSDPASDGADIQNPTHISSLSFEPMNNHNGETVGLRLFSCGPGLHFENCIFLGPASRPGDHGGFAYPWTPDPPLGGDGGEGSCDEAVDVPGGPGDNFYSYCAGGSGGLPGQSGQEGQNGHFPHPDFPDAGLGGAGGLPGHDGQDGTAGIDGDDGQHGAPLESRVYLHGTQLALPDPDRGGYGTSGSRGGGGGGGGGSSTGTGNGGGAGGGNGAGSTGGTGGECGYPCIAVLSVNSQARFTNCHFQAGDGGNGGNGGQGVPGGEGWPGGSGGSFCVPEVGRGGNGGHGGNGGSSGGGAGGHGGDSLGIWVLGTGLPVVDDDCTFTVGEAGSGGLGGLHGNGQSRAENGLDGRSAEILDERDSP